MVRTAICDLFGIEVPIVGAPVGPAAAAELAAAVSNAGGLGSISMVMRKPDDARNQIQRVRELTDRPFALNHLVNLFDEDVFELTLEARPVVISFALGDPGDLIRRVHEAGILAMQQVHTVQGARRAAERGVDAIVAQGGEAGGNSGTVATLPLVPQVVDAVRPIPVIAAGGIADGRGLAAALALGAQGINIGTRLLASNEAAAAIGWKETIVTAKSEDAVKFEAWNAAFPPSGGDYETAPRTIRTTFVEEWQDGSAHDGAALRDQLLAAAHEGRVHELVPLAGQTAGMIHEILPVAEIVRQIMDRAEAAIRQLTEHTGDQVAESPLP